MFLGIYCHLIGGNHLYKKMDERRISTSCQRIKKLRQNILDMSADIFWRRRSEPRVCAVSVGRWSRGTEISLIRGPHLITGGTQLSIKTFHRLFIASSN